VWGFLGEAFLDSAIQFSIAQHDADDALELMRDILLAEGLAAESYLDTGNRGIFANADVPAALHPMFPNDQAHREAASCLPFVSAPHLVKPHWRQLYDRAAAITGNAPRRRQ
jgi:hypothetical protein